MNMVTIIHYVNTKGKSLLELWNTIFHPDWQPTLIFVWFILNFLCMCSIGWLLLMCFEVNQTKIKGGCQSRRKVVPHDSKSNLPLIQKYNAIQLIGYHHTYLLTF